MYREKRINEIDIQIGARLRELRVLHGFSQTKVASALGLTFQQIQKYEKGVNRVSGSKLVNLCKLFGVTPNEIVGNDHSSRSDEIAILSTHAIKIGLRYDKLNTTQKKAISTMLTAMENEDADQ